MKKLLGIALVLAVVTTLGFSSLAFAADPTEVTVNFNGDNPDVTVTAVAPGPGTGCNSFDRVAQFTLTGSSHAIGTLATSIGRRGSLGVWATVSGGYTATDGDFKSSFIADYFSTGNTYDGEVWHSEHSIDATGVTEGSLNVLGYAEAGAVSGKGYLGAGQLFSGKAASATITGDRHHEVWGSNPYADPVVWSYGGTNKWATFSGTVTGSSPVQFGGYTDGSSYGLDYSDPPELVRTLECSQRTGGSGACYYIGCGALGDGLGFAVDINGSDLDGTLKTNYPYTSMVAFDGAGNFIDTDITHDTGWAIIEAFNADELGGSSAMWDGYPGYTGPLPE